MKTQWMALPVVALALTIGPKAVETTGFSKSLTFRDDGEPDYGRIFQPAWMTQEQTAPVTPTAREQELQADLDKARSDYNSTLNWIVGNLSGRIAVPADLVDTLDAPVFDEQFQLNPSLKLLVRATDLEVSAINDGLLVALTEARTLWSGIIRPSSVSMDEWVVTVPPHEADGEAIRARLMEAVTAAIGPARASLFWRASARDLNRTFIYFGAGARVIRCTNLLGENGYEGVRIRDELITADESGLRHIEAIEFESPEMPAAYAYFDRVAHPADAADATE